MSLLCLALSAQNSFHKKLQHNGFELQAFDYKSGLGFGIGDFNASQDVSSLIKLDENGILVWASRYEGFQWSKIQDIVLTNDGGAVALYYVKVDANLPELSKVLVKFNGQGQKVWDVRLGFTVSYSPNKIAQTPDGGFLVSQSEFFGDFKCSKVSSDGELLWLKAYDGGGDDFSVTVGVAQDGNYILAGGSNAPFPNKDAGVVMKISPLGFPVWTKAFQDAFFWSVDDFSNGDLLLTGKIVSENTQIVLRINNLGEFVWAKSFPLTAYVYGYEARVAADEGVVFYTNIDEENNSIIKMDGNGEFLWTRDISSSQFGIGYNRANGTGGIAAATNYLQNSLWATSITLTDSIGDVQDCPMDRRCFNIGEFVMESIGQAWTSFDWVPDTFVEGFSLPTNVTLVDFCFGQAVPPSPIIVRAVFPYIECFCARRKPVSLERRI